MVSSREQLRQRSKEATQHLEQMLHIADGANNAKLLETALVEIVVEEGRRNPNLAKLVRQRFDELASLQSDRGGNTSHPNRVDLPPLVPIRKDLPYRASDPASPPDLRYLILAYGTHQLARALQDYKLDTLKRTAETVQLQHPGTKPTSRANKAAVIAYIVKYSNGS